MFPHHGMRHNQRVSRRTARALPAADPTGPCPCGLDRGYPDCCGRLHAGHATASTARELMRSRYSAFAVADEAYLLRSWHSSTRPARVGLDPRQQWSRLVVIGSTGGSLLHAEGTVEFRADYRVGGRTDSLHENSRFLREAGNWVYLAPVPG